MNAVDELIREFATLPDDDGSCEREASDVARRRLRRAVADERRPKRRRWRLAVPAVVAAGLAAVILAVVALVPGREESAPAAVVLERVADVANRQPAGRYPGPHQYLYLKFREGWTQVQNGIAFGTTDTQQTWVAPDGAGRQRLIVDGPPRFLTRQDRATWLAAGRPRLVPASTDGTYPAGGYPAGNMIDPRSLPTDPAALRQAIVQRFEGGTFNVGRTFELAGTLLQDSGSPALRAALYRMVSQLAGVELLGRQTDALGRHGIAVALAEADGARGELLFDPATSDVLEAEDVQAALGPVRGLPVGTVLHYFAYEGRGVVDSITALPDGGHVQFRPGS